MCGCDYGCGCMARVFFLLTWRRGVTFYIGMRGADEYLYFIQLQCKVQAEINLTLNVEDKDNIN